MSTLVERLEAMAAKEGVCGQSDVRRLAFLEAAAALRATTGEGEWVPKDVWDWLMGANGEFECPDPDYYSGHPPKYWWRRELRRRIAAAPTPPLRDAGAVDAEPVAKIVAFGSGEDAATYVTILRKVPSGTLLYTHPAPAQVDEHAALVARLEEADALIRRVIDADWRTNDNTLYPALLAWADHAARAQTTRVVAGNGGGDGR